MNRWILVCIFVLIGVLCPPLSAQHEVVYFYEEGCPQCEKVSFILDELSQEYSITITKYDVGTVEGYNLFTQYKFTTTPALIVNGKRLEGEIERSDILKAVLLEYEWYHFLVALLLGLLSGLSPTLMRVHADIIAEVARTTRQEIDVVVRSLLFCAGIFCIAFCLFFVFDVIGYLHFAAVLVGIVFSLNLLNSGLHAFNSYTRIDLYIKAKFITLEPASLLKLGGLHGLLKFSDSVPLFLPVMYLVITRGGLSQDFILCALFFIGIIVSYLVILVLAIIQVNLFRTFKDELVSQVYFSVSGLFVMAMSGLLLWEILDEVHVGAALTLTVAVVVVSGVLIGFKRRIIY